MQTDLSEVPEGTRGKYASFESNSNLILRSEDSQWEATPYEITNVNRTF
jgi:hypothetical protein